MTFLHGVFRFAMKKGWTSANPAAAVDRPKDIEVDADIRFLTHEEVEALLRQATDEEIRKRSLARAGVREIHFHDLRQTFGTQAAAAGVPLRALQELMGHRDFKTTLIYADYAPRSEERQMMERAFASPGPSSVSALSCR